MTTDTANSPLITIGEASLLLHVSVSTLRRWEAEGKITAKRTPGGHRRFLLEEVRGLLTETAKDGA